MNRCPRNSEGIKTFVIDSFHKRSWDKGLARKKKYYIENFDRTYNHHKKIYIGANISWRAKIIVSQLRTNSHHICCETRHWKILKEAWEESVWMFSTSKKVETKKHFILECEAFKDNKDNYISILTTSSWNNLFSEGTMEKLGELIIKLNRKRDELQKSVCEAICPIGYS